MLHVHTKAADPQPRRRLLEFLKPLQCHTSESCAGDGSSTDVQVAVQEDTMAVREARWVDAKQASVHVYTGAYSKLTEPFHHPGYAERLLKGMM